MCGTFFSLSAFTRTQCHSHRHSHSHSAYVCYDPARPPLYPKAAALVEDPLSAPTLQVLHELPDCPGLFCSVLCCAVLAWPGLGWAGTMYTLVVYLFYYLNKLQNGCRLTKAKWPSRCQLSFQSAPSLLPPRAVVLAKDLSA